MEQSNTSCRGNMVVADHQIRAIDTSKSATESDLLFYLVVSDTSFIWKPITLHLTMTTFLPKETPITK